MRTGCACETSRNDTACNHHPRKTNHTAGDHSACGHHSTGSNYPAGIRPITPPKVSYAATTYTNDEYGFIYVYPSAMVSAPPKAKYNILEAAEAMGVPTIGVSILDTAKIEAQTEESLKSAGGSDIKTVSTMDVTLADGKTKGKLTELHWKSSGYDITTLSIAVDRPGGKTVSVSYTSLKDMIDLKAAKEVVNTLTFK